MGALDGILSLGKTFTEGMISHADKYSKDEKFSDEQRTYYRNLSVGLRNGLDKIDEYHDKAPKRKPLTSGSVQRPEYSQSAIKAMSLMEPYFGIYRTIKKDSWFFYDTAPTHHQENYNYIKKVCESLNLIPYITIHNSKDKNSYAANRSITLCDYGIIEVISNPGGGIISDNPCWFAYYEEMKSICFVTHTSGGASYDMEFGEKKFLSLRDYPELICYEDSYEKDEIINKLVHFLELVNGKCNVIKKTKLL